MRLISAVKTEGGKDITAKLPALAGSEFVRKVTSRV